MKKSKKSAKAAGLFSLVWVLLVLAINPAFAQQPDWETHPDIVEFGYEPLYAVQDLRRSVLDKTGAENLIGWHHLYHHSDLFLVRIHLANASGRALRISPKNEGLDWVDYLAIHVKRLDQKEALVRGQDFQMEVLSRELLQTRFTADAAKTKTLEKPRFEMRPEGYYAPVAAYENHEEIRGDVAQLPDVLQPFESVIVTVLFRKDRHNYLDPGVYQLEIGFDSTPFKYRLPPYQPRVFSEGPMTIAMEEAADEHGKVLAHMVRANFAREQGDWTDVENNLRWATEEVPDSAYAWQELTLYYRGRGQNPSAGLASAKHWQKLLNAKNDWDLDLLESPGTPELVEEMIGHLKAKLAGQQ